MTHYLTFAQLAPGVIYEMKHPKDTDGAYEAYNLISLHLSRNFADVIERGTAQLLCTLNRPSVRYGHFVFRKFEVTKLSESKTIETTETQIEDMKAEIVAVNNGLVRNLDDLEVKVNSSIKKIEDGLCGVNKRIDSMCNRNERHADLVRKWIEPLQTADLEASSRHELLKSQIDLLAHDVKLQDKTSEVYELERRVNHLVNTQGLLLVLVGALTTAFVILLVQLWFK